MKGRIWLCLAGIAALAAIIAVPSALAAYTSPKLQVQQAGDTVTIKASQATDDDPTAVVLIGAPSGTQLTTTQAPGTVLGNVDALIIATTLGGAQVPVKGQVVVAAPGQVPADEVTACLGGQQPAAVWLLVLSAAGQQLSLPVYLVSDPAVAIVACLPYPATATIGAKLVSAAFSIKGVFSPVSVGAWIAIWIPWSADGTSVNEAGAVASPAAVAPGAVTIAAKRSGKAGAIVTGKVTQAGQARGGASVQIFGGTKKTGLKRLGRASVGSSGTFRFKARAGTYFRATAVAASVDAPPLCTALAPALAPIPCVNATTSGFTAQSKTVKKK